MNWFSRIVKVGFSILDDARVDDVGRDFSIGEGVAEISFNFTKMQAQYSCREDPEPTEFDLKRDADGHWQIRSRAPLWKTDKWHAWVAGFPVWANKEDLIEEAYQRFKNIHSQ